MSTAKIVFPKANAIANIHTRMIGPNTKESSLIVELSVAHAVEGLIAAIKSPTNIHIGRFFFEVLSFVIIFAAFAKPYLHFD